MSAAGRGVGAALLGLAALSVAGCTVGSAPPPASDAPALAIVRGAEQDGRFDVYLTGSMPTRAQLGLAAGRTEVSLEPDDRAEPIEVTFTLVGDRRFVVPATSVLVSTPFLDVTDARSPGAVDDALLPPNEVEATQVVGSSAEAHDLLVRYADLLELDEGDIEAWFVTAPAGPGPDVVLAKQFFASTSRIGYVDVEVGVYVDATSEYLTWTLSWDPPIPGYAYDTDGRPRPTSS